jgi:hypothetical protein
MKARANIAMRGGFSQTRRVYQDGRLIGRLQMLRIDGSLIWRFFPRNIVATPQFLGRDDAHNTLGEALEWIRAILEGGPVPQKIERQQPQQLELLHPTMGAHQVDQKLGWLLPGEVTIWSRPAVPKKAIAA